MGAVAGWEELGDDISTLPLSALPLFRSRPASDALLTSPCDLHCCGGEYDSQVESCCSSPSTSATSLSLARTPIAVTNSLRPRNPGAFTPRGSTLRVPEIPFCVRLKRSASARDVEIAHFSKKVAGNRGDMEPRREQSPRKPPATRGAANLSLEALLMKLAARGKRLPKLALNAVMYQLTRAVAHANCLGVCHRDVCPGNVMVQESSYMTELTGWDHPPARLSPYSAPELFLSEEPAILEHMKADVWSLGMVFVEGLKGSPLVQEDPQKPLLPHLVLAAWFKSIGTPSEAALRILSPSGGWHEVRKIIQRRPWDKLLRLPRTYPDCIELLDRMLDWNPATREPAVSLLSFPYFATTRAETFMYKAVAQCELTTAEIEGIISAVFAAHASCLAAKREAATWISSSPPEPPTSESLTSDAACGKLRSRRRSISERRGSFTGIHLVTIPEDPLGEVAWRKAGTPSPQAATPSAVKTRSANPSPVPPVKNAASGSADSFSP